MLRRLVWTCLLAAVFAVPAHAGVPQQLMPGVTLTKSVQFTPHGAVALTVITAPRPGGLYQLAPVLAHGTVEGGLERLTQIEQDVSATATVAGINGDFSAGADAHPVGVFMDGGVLEHPPSSGRSSIGIDGAGQLHVDRVRFFGTWQGTGQRRPLDGINQVPEPGTVELFTPAYGANLPAVAGSAEAILASFPAATPNVDLQATVTAVGSGGGEAIPAGGAVVMATGAAAAKLQAEAPVGATLTTRLILQPSWTGIASALGGGPVIVKNGKPVFRSLEDFTNTQVAARLPRAGVGQLADGRIVLVVVDGNQPGYSAGMTSFELGQAMARLGAVTASAVQSGSAVTAAFDGQVLNRPPAAPQPVKEALLVEYFGVYAAQPPLPLLNGDPGATVEPLTYKLVRPSTVTAELIGPDGNARVLENAVVHQPGSYADSFTSYDAEGTWHWHVQATDDLGRVSVVDRTFRYDTTLRALSAPRTARGRATIRFTLSRAASVALRIETPTGVVVRTLPAVSMPAGAQALVWDGRLQEGTRAYSGSYVAHVFVTSSVGTSDLMVPFTFRRT
jgi:hypothetical protein